MQARVGAVGAGKEWFKPWRTISGREDASSKLTELQVVLEGVFEQCRFLDLLRYFIVFQDDGSGKIIKKMAEREREKEERVGFVFAVCQWGGELGVRRVGVVWHTLGSGKSLTMAFY